MSTVQIFVEVVSHPVQLLKDEPASGVAIRFTLVPCPAAFAAVLPLLLGLLRLK